MPLRAPPNGISIKYVICQERLIEILFKLLIYKEEYLFMNCIFNRMVTCRCGHKFEYIFNEKCVVFLCKLVAFR